MADVKKGAKNVAKTVGAAYMIRLHFAGRRAANGAMVRAVKNDYGHSRRAFASGYGAAARHPHEAAGLTGIALAGGAAYGAYRYHKHRGEVNMAKRKSGKGSWAGGKAPAQGNTPRRVSRPEEGALQKSPFKKGTKTAAKKSTSPKSIRGKKK